MIREHSAGRSDDERRFMERLRALYENRGYAFIEQPQAGQLPNFLGSYRPDALASRSEHNVVIEVKCAPGSTAEQSLERIRRLFDDQAGWQFQVFFIGDASRHPVSFPALDPSMIRAGLGEVRTLVASGHRRAAFILGWSNLEAAFRLRTKQWDDRLLDPGTLVQTLAMNGYIEPDTERGARALVDLRNRIVHGDLAAEPTDDEVEQILAAVEETVFAEAA